MKKLFLILTGVFLGISSQAQQIPWGEMKLKSPEFNATDSTITFRFDAPNASKVEIHGDFISGKPLPMKKDSEGIWTINVGKLPSDLYGYTIFVDGLQVLDPSNVYVMRDNNTLNNVMIVPGQRGELFSTNDVPHGTVSTVWYHSDTLNMDRRLTVYTPAEYGKIEDKRYPVLYLLHGLGGDEEAWAEKGRVPQILDNMISKGEVEPMLVVMTNGNSPQQAAPGKNSDGLFVQPTSKLPFVSGAFEASFPEIVKYIDSSYNTVAEKSGRAIAGLSMGGMHTRAISMNNPEMFDYVGLFSAAINPMFRNPTAIYENIPEKLKAQFVNPPKMYWIGIGKTDFLMEANTKNRGLMDELGLPYTYHESEGGHTWTNWRDYLTIILPSLFKK